VTEVADGDEWPVSGTNWVDVTTPGDPADAAALTLNLRDGRRDVVVTTTGDDPVSAAGVDLDGQRAFARFSAKGDVSELMLQEGTSLSAGGVSIGTTRDAWGGKVVAVESRSGVNRVMLDTLLPRALRKQGILFDEADTS